MKGQMCQFFCAREEIVPSQQSILVFSIPLTGYGRKGVTKDSTYHGLGFWCIREIPCKDKATFSIFSRPIFISSDAILKWRLGRGVEMVIEWLPLCRDILTKLDLSQITKVLRPCMVTKLFTPLSSGSLLVTWHVLFSRQWEYQRSSH